MASEGFFGGLGQFLKENQNDEGFQGYNPEGVSYGAYGGSWGSERLIEQVLHYMRKTGVMEKFGRQAAEQASGEMDAVRDLQAFFTPQGFSKWRTHAQQGAASDADIIGTRRMHEAEMLGFNKNMAKGEHLNEFNRSRYGMNSTIGQFYNPLTYLQARREAYGMMPSQTVIGIMDQHLAHRTKKQGKWGGALNILSGLSGAYADIKGAG